MSIIAHFKEIMDIPSVRFVSSRTKGQYGQTMGVKSPGGTRQTEQDTWRQTDKQTRWELSLRPRLSHHKYQQHLIIKSSCSQCKHTWGETLMQIFITGFPCYSRRCLSRKTMIREYQNTHFRLKLYLFPCYLRLPPVFWSANSQKREYLDRK